MYIIIGYEDRVNNFSVPETCLTSGGNKKMSEILKSYIEMYDKMSDIVC